VWKWSIWLWIMSLVNTPSTKAEGECHSSIFYGLFKNENEWVTWMWRILFLILLTINHWRIWRWSFSFEWRFEHCGVVVVCNVVENECGRRDMTWARVITMMTIMTMRPLPNYNQQEMIYQTKIQQQLFVVVGMIDEFYQTLVFRTIFNIQYLLTT
jgi:hypothetical protein